MLKNLVTLLLKIVQQYKRALWLTNCSLSLSDRLYIAVTSQPNFSGICVNTRQGLKSMNVRVVCVCVRVCVCVMFVCVCVCNFPRIE